MPLKGTKTRGFPNQLLHFTIKVSVRPLKTLYCSLQCLKSPPKHYQHELLGFQILSSILSSPQNILHFDGSRNHRLPDVAGHRRRVQAGQKGQSVEGGAESCPRRGQNVRIRESPATRHRRTTQGHRREVH